MAAVVHGVSFASTLNQATYTTNSFTPAANDLLVCMTIVTGTATDPGTVSDSLSGTWTRVEDSGSGTNLFSFFIRDSLVSGAAMTVTVDVTGDAGTGCIIFIARVSGMTRTGAEAKRQSDVDSGASATTPTATFPANCLTGNPTLGMVGNGTNPAGVTPPTNWTEQSDTGFATPTTGGEYVSRDSGFTGNVITWGSTSASAWTCIGLELDTSAPPSAPAIIKFRQTPSGVRGTDFTARNLRARPQFIYFPYFEQPPPAPANPVIPVITPAWRHWDWPERRSHAWYASRDQRPRYFPWISFQETFSVYEAFLQYDATQYTPAPAVAFEVLMQSSTGAEVKARLFNITDGVEVAGSALTTTSTSLVRLRSGALTLSGAKEYRAEARQTASVTTTLGAARLVVQQ